MPAPLRRPVAPGPSMIITSVYERWPCIYCGGPLNTDEILEFRPFRDAIARRVQLGKCGNYICPEKVISRAAPDTWRLLGPDDRAWLLSHFVIAGLL